MPLIFSRREGESFIVTVPSYSEPVKVTLKKLRGGRVRVVVDAPKEVEILREELTGVLRTESGGE